MTGLTRLGLPGSTLSRDDSPHSRRPLRAATAASPLAVLQTTAETPPSWSTSGWADWMPQKSPRVMSEPQERFEGQERQEGRRLAFARNALMYQSSRKTRLSAVGAGTGPSFSAAYPYAAEKDNHPVVLLRMFTARSAEPAVRSLCSAHFSQRSGDGTP